MNEIKVRVIVQRKILLLIKVNEDVELRSIGNMQQVLN